MDNLNFVTYCGLYCGLCSARGRLPKQARELRELMSQEGYEYWGGELPNFKEFWEFLTDLSDPEKACPGCWQGGGPPFCGIRKCVQKRNIEICVYCEEYPCHRVEALGKGYPTLIADGVRMRELGVEKWVEEQEERAKTGFAYVDIRCHPYEVPSD